MFRQLLVAPVGKQHTRDVAAFVSRSKTTVARLFADDTHDFACVLVEDKDGNGKSKILEILTYTEEIRSEVVLQQEVLDVALHLCGAFLGVVLQACAIAHFGIELHTGGERFIIFNLRDDVIGHSVIHSPWNETLPTVEDTAVKLRVLTEHCAAIRHKSH